MKFKKPKVVGVQVISCEDWTLKDCIIKEGSIMEPEEVLCTYDCEKCGMVYQDKLYPDEPSNCCYCQECRKIRRYSMLASNGGVVPNICKDGEWVRYEDIKPLIDAARDIEHGCSYPTDEMQKAILKRLRPMIAILPK